jgi:RNA polymerase sigma-70 factor (ECF subfamily)
MAKVQIPSGLIGRIADGDEKAFEELYRLTYRPLFSFLLSLTADHESAKDLMQETYLSVFVSAHRYRERGNPLAWIMKIGKNLFLMKKRKRESGMIYLEDAGDTAPEIPYSMIEDIEARETLRSLFEVLGREERSIVALHDLSGFRHREIAEIMDLPVGTVLSKYNRAIRKMREYARREGWQEK